MSSVAGETNATRALLNLVSAIDTLHHKVLSAHLNAEAELVRTPLLEAIVGKGLRRIRGAIGMGLTWAAAWFAAGLVPRWLFGFNTDVPFPLVFGVLGFVAGVMFSGLLGLMEGRRTFDQMSLPRFASLGAVSGVLLAAIFTRAASLDFGEVLAIAPTFAIACAVCASGSLALARRAELRELLDNPGNTAVAKLSNYEKRQLH